MNLLLDTDERETKLPKQYQTSRFELQIGKVDSWDYKTLRDGYPEYLEALVAESGLTIDYLGCTDKLKVIVAKWSAVTRLPTTDAYMLHELIKMRKSGKHFRAKK